jgi:DNA recombination protein RmuC
MTVDFIVILAAGIGGVVLGWLLAAIRYLPGLTRARQHAEGLVEDNRRSAEEVRGLRELLEAEQLERVKAQTRFEDAQESLRQQGELLEEARAKLAETFQALSGDALKNNSRIFLDLAGGTLSSLAAEIKGDLGKRQEAIGALVKPLEEALKRYESHLREMEGARQSAYGDLTRYIAELIRTQEQLHEQTRSLSHALKVPQVKGRWGEITLRRVVEISGMSSRCDFTEQPSVQTDSGVKRPDLIIRLPRGRQVVVDAKLPISAYMEACSTEDEKLRQELMARHAQALRSHVVALSSKEYFKQFDPAPDFVVLFLASEAFFSAALDHDSTLIEDAIDRGVIITTPTTLIALLRTVALTWQQHAASENAEKILKGALELFERVRVFARHFEKLKEGIQKTSQAYNAAARSWETRVLPSADRLQKLGVIKQDTRLPEIGYLDGHLVGAAPGEDPESGDRHDGAGMPGEDGPEVAKG